MVFQEYQVEHVITSDILMGLNQIFIRGVLLIAERQMLGYEI